MKRLNQPLTLCAVIALSLVAYATEEDKAAAAEQAGNLREAVTHYTAAFQALPWTDPTKVKLEEKIINLAVKLDPPPAIPEEAERRSARGRAALEAATTPAELVDAAKEFLEAKNQAPWWPDPHFNLGVVREKQGYYQPAINNFKHYLAAKPQADDAKAVKDKIYKLEFLAEKQAKSNSPEGRTPDLLQANIAPLAGRWEGIVTYHMEWLNAGGIQHHNEAFELRFEGKDARLVDLRNNRIILMGRINGESVSNISWQIGPLQAFAGSPVAVSLSRSSMQFVLPANSEGRRIDGFHEFNLQKH